MQQTQSEFPQQYASLDAHSLRNAYASGPARLRAVLTGLTASQVKERARGEGTWAVNEITLHLADAEIIGSARFRMALSMPGASLPAYDQDAFATGLAYHSQSLSALEDAVQMFETLRRATLRLLDASMNQWSASYGVHAEFGAVTVRNLLELYADHGERHIEQILEVRRRIGSPIALSPILPDRLY